MIVKWDLKRKKKKKNRDRETKGLFHFYLPTKTLLIYEKQMCGQFEKKMKRMREFVARIMSDRISFYSAFAAVGGHTTRCMNDSDMNDVLEK